LDPEVVAALDEDFNFDDPDNQLEDNFIELAMGEGKNYNRCCCTASSIPKLSKGTLIIIIISAY
jgi:hypothetical protein